VALAAQQALIVGAVNHDDVPVAGVNVIALLWPNSVTLGALAKGDSVPTIALPTVRADLSGRFSIRLDPASIPAAYRDVHGHTQVELQMTAGDHQVAWDFSATRRGTSWVSARPIGNGRQAAPTVETAVFDLGRSPRVTELAGRAAAQFASGGTAALRPVAAVGDVPDQSTSRISSRTALSNTPAVCVYVAGDYLYNRAEPFMHVYPGQHAPAKVTQSYGVDHSLGIAIGPGSWSGGSAGGTVTLSLTASGSRNLTSNSTVFNSINFRDYVNVCGWTHRQAISVYAILQRIDPAAEPAFLSCAEYSSGVYTKSRGVNITFRSEVNVGAVSVDAQSGWTSSSEVAWTVNSRSWLCGSSPSGWASAPEAEANSA
jgi:hypothetical protein